MTFAQLRQVTASLSHSDDRTHTLEDLKVSIMSQLPVDGQFEQQPRPPKPGNRRPIWAAIGLLAVAAIVVGAVSLAGGFSHSGARTPTTFTLHGSVTLIPTIGLYDVLFGAGTCQGEGPYSDLSPGTAVLVANAQGQTVGTGSLESGIPQPGDVVNNCMLPFDVAGVPIGLASYSVTISHRGTQVVSPNEAHAGVALTIGGS